MAGLKTFWITLSTLLLFAACVPQTKQTECKSNEAFNASLRSCVPVVGGPSSFIKIDSYNPAFTQTRYKDDTTTLSFTITVSNPYDQSYTVEWERVFNAAPVSMCSNALSCSFPASLLGNVMGQVGTHILTAKIKDGNGSVVDSHSFELKINELPRPVINTATLTPSSYAFDVLPTDPRVQFSFNIKNNSATISAGDNYRTIWTVTKNGSAIYTESDSFTSFTPNGTNTAYLGVSPTPWFNPGSTAIGVGSYIIRAVVQNDVPGEVVAEQQWNVIVKQPDLANVTTIASPAPGVTITAYNGVSYGVWNGVDYGPYSTLNWIYGSPVQKPNFCVTVDDRDGTYPGDGKSIQIKWYLNSTGGDICTKKTLDTPGTQTVCLNDANQCDGSAAVFDTSILVLTNSNSTSPQTHKVTARLFDEATTFEFQRSDVMPSNGSYPIEWIVNNKPINTAPVMGFGTSSLNPTGCVSSGVGTRSGCRVNQGTNFTVSFTATDDFYNPTDAAEVGNFQWDVKLKYNGADITSPDATKNTSCSKAFATGTTMPVASTSGYSQVAPTANQWICTLAVPHYVSTGPLDPTSGNYQVVATMQDFDSKVGGTGQISQPLTWNLVVTETNPSNLDVRTQAILTTDSHVIRSTTPGNLSTVLTSTLGYATELEAINFRPSIDDAELDNFKYRISLCKDNTAACTNPSTLTSPAYVDLMRALQVTPSANPLVIPGFSYTIPEDFLISRHTPGIDLATSSQKDPANPGQTVYFKVDVYDVPSTTPPVAPYATKSDSEIFAVRIQNYNPAPVINEAGAVPAPSTTPITVYSGYQFTINPGTISDASGVSAEKNLQYQWYSRIGAGAWAAIPGTLNSVSPVLRYTPGDTTSDIELKLCFGDGTAANPVAAPAPTGTGSCSSTWVVRPKTYLMNLPYTDSDLNVATTINNEVAVWYDDLHERVSPASAAREKTQVIYSAYVDDSFDIWVEKTVIKVSTNTITNLSSIKFPALRTGTASVVSNLSITGTQDSLYISYLASVNTAPSTFFPRIRRIDKSFDDEDDTAFVNSSRKYGLADPAPFGFNYDPYTLTANCSLIPCTVSGATTNAVPRTITFGGTGRLSTLDTITIRNTTFTAGTDICDSTTCASGNSTAQNIANKINSSTLPDLQGIRANASGSTVELYTSWDGDYLDFDGSMTSIAPNIVALAGGIGKIFIANGNWFLPVINSTLGGSQQNNITMLSNSVDAHLQASQVSDSNILTGIGNVVAFDHQISQLGELVIASISGANSTAGKLTLSRYALSGATWAIFDPSTTPSTSDNATRDLFSGFSFEYVKLAADKLGNDFFYVIAREKSIYGGEYHIGRYTKDLDSATHPEYMLTSKLLNTDSTALAISADSFLKFPVLESVPGFAEARIFFHSKGTGAISSAVEHPRLARWRADDTISCGTCFSLSGNLEYQAGAPVAISQVANDIALGTTGFTGGENTNDLMFVLMSSDRANDDVFRPQLGLINVEAESIQSTTYDSSGRWIPPFVLDQ